MCLIIIISTAQVYAQNKFTIQGRVLDNEGIPLIAVTITSTQLKAKALTNAEGRFALINISPGTYTLQASYVGYKTISKTITVKNNSMPEVIFRLEESGEQLSEVKVIGKTETQRVKEQPIKAEVINTKSLQEQPSSLVEMMNRSAGIRIRQSGGLGSESNLMINGFQGRSVKYFKDGVPMDYLGAGFNISIVPVNMLERVEAYKGVLPAYLGADALGGAVNLVTKQSFTKHLEASYEIASFNTHRVSLNGFYKNQKNGLFIGADAFYNYSKNNYPVDVVIPDPDSGDPQAANVKLFHNKYDNYYAELYAGMTDKKWADELRIGLTAFNIDRENQFGATMEKPFGEAASRQYSVVPTIRYKKTFLEKRLTVDQFLVANNLNVEQVDTASRIYDWNGNYTISNTYKGEITTNTGALPTYKYSYYTSRSNFSYNINSKNTLNFNVVFAGFNRTGRDPLGIKFKDTGEDVLGAKARYDKTILSLGLETRLFDDRLTNNTIVKFFGYKTDAKDADWVGNATFNKNSNSKFGIAEALKFNLTSHSFLRASAETALRLPEQDELFGDGNLKLSNFALKPERSLNINLGYRTEKLHSYALEFNTFYRVTRDLILNVPYNFIYSQSQNIQQVKGYGFEGDFGANVTKWLKANVNFTYQSLRLFDTNNPSTEGSRLRNTPYFFANSGLNSTHKKLFNKKDKLDVYLYYQFVRAYYLDNIPKNKEPDGFLGLWGQAKLDARNIIPSQNIVSTGFTYNPLNNGVSFGFQVKNIFDTPVYDNFKVQNMGRSFHLKLNYIIK